MPELPDIEAYTVTLKKQMEGGPLTNIRLVSPFLLHTARSHH